MLTTVISVSGQQGRDRVYVFASLRGALMAAMRMIRKIATRRMAIWDDRDDMALRGLLESVIRGSRASKSVYDMLGVYDLWRYYVKATREDLDFGDVQIV